MLRFLGLERTPPEVLKQRETLRARLIIGQYIVLAYAAYQFVTGSPISAVVTAGIATYLEKITAAAYANILKDPETAKFLTDHYSNVTQLSNLFNPVIDQVHSMIQKDMNSLKIKPA